MKAAHLIPAYLVLVALSNAAGQSFTPIVDPKMMQESITPLTPDVATLGQYTVQPPNLSNGLPQQNIPIVEIKENGLSYPISLFYNYSGFKVKEEASSYGLGWGMTEDIIIRVVKHVPDENTGLLKSFEEFEGDMTEEYGFGEAPPMGTGSSTHPDMFYQEYNLTQNRLYYKLYDAQPDVYIYNCGGYSGKFLWINDRAINLEYNDVLIYGEKIGVVRQRFTLWTPEGIRYVFDEADRTWTENPEIVSPPLCSNADILETYVGYPYTTTWRVSEIRNNATKAKIAFTYKSQITTEVKDIEQITSVVFHAPENLLGQYFATDFKKEETYVKTMNETFFLDEISSDNYQIEFITKSRSDGGEFRMDSIKVFSKQNLQQPVKTVAFDHSYFGNTSAPTTCWLKLKGVNVDGMGDNARFDFSYINELFTSGELAKQKLAIDHWGYFNNYPNTTLVPLTGTIQAYIQNNSNLPLGIISWANRNPDTLYNKLFALETVQLPTKGSLSYAYENANGKGIRVRSVHENDGQNVTARYYEYDSNGQTQPFYPWSEYGVWDVCSLWYPNGQWTSQITTFSAYVDGPPDFLGDDNNFYENVTEYIGSPTGRGGITKYKFQKLFGYGNKVLLKEKTEYEYGNQSFLRKEENFYSMPVTNQIYFWKIPELNSMPKLGPVCPFPENPTCGPVDPLDNFPYILGHFAGGIDHLFQVWIRLDSTTHTMDTLVTTKRFYYKSIDSITSLPAHVRIIREEKATSKGPTQVVEMFYPGETDPDNSPIKLGLARMYDMSVDSIYLVSPIVKAKITVGNNLISKEASIYSYDPINQLVIRTGYSLHPMGVQTGKQSWEFAYDHNGNIVNVMKERDNPTSVVYGYDDSVPIVRAENVDASVLRAAVFASSNDLDQLLQDVGDMTLPTQKNAWVAFNNALRGNLSPTCVFTTYTHIPLVGITSQTDLNGVATYFEYDEFGRIKCVKDNDGNIVKTSEYHYRD